MNAFNFILQWGSWPFLIAACIAITAYGFEAGQPLLYFNLAYLFLIVNLLWLERAIPHERQWHEPDKQNFANIAHTISSKGTVQSLLMFGGIIGLASILKPAAEPVGYGIWPRDWHMAVQVVLGLYVAELMLYWAHRLSHEVPFFWRFHAIHHSVKRLWIINTGRFHFVDSLISIVMAMALLLILGAPLEVIKWLSALTAFIGILTHCNVDMKFGPISYIFNTPELHRWHHSKDLREGNRNYGENVMLWDQLFGSFINPKDRRPPVDIGISDYMPDKFWHQLLWPLISAKKRQELCPDYVYKPFVREGDNTKSSTS